MIRRFIPQRPYRDRTVLLWTWSTLDKQRRCQRINIDFDHAVKVQPHPSKPELFIHKSQANCIEQYELHRGSGDTSTATVTTGATFPMAHRLDADIVGFGMACNGSFLMSCSSQSDLVIWSPHDQRRLATVDTCLGNNYAAKVSFCGRFVAACGFSPDAKVWEVQFKAGKFVATKNVFNLSGHSSGIYDIAFDQDSSHMATVSKDGTWKLYDTQIDYQRGQLPRCALTAKYTSHDFGEPSKIALSSTGQVVAIANGRTVHLYSAIDGRRDATLDAIVPSEIVALAFHPTAGRYLLVAGDKIVRVMHNVTGFRVAAAVARNRLAATGNGGSSATRDRLQAQIDENDKAAAQFAGI